MKVRIGLFLTEERSASMHRRLSILKYALAIVFGIVTAFAPCGYAITVDDFSNGYPANPDLPTALYELIFVGTMCDGSSCPPGTMVSHLVSDVAHQTGLSGVLGGERYALITYVLGTANSVMYEAGNMLTFNHNAMASAKLALTYGLSDDLNADFTAMGATELQVNVTDGDMYSGPRPVPCTITVTSGRGTPNEHTASVTTSLVLAGVYSYPFSSFAGIDFTDVDRIAYLFDASLVQSVDFAIGPLVTDEHEVATQPTTWGAVKSLFR
jgi:hypothetical protein